MSSFLIECRGIVGGVCDEIVSLLLPILMWFYSRLPNEQELLSYFLGFFERKLFLAGRFGVSMGDGEFRIFYVAILSWNSVV